MLRLRRMLFGAAFGAHAAGIAGEIVAAIWAVAVGRIVRAAGAAVLEAGEEDDENEIREGDCGEEDTEQATAGGYLSDGGVMVHVVPLRLAS